MTRPELSEGLRKFLMMLIETFEHLEVLMLLYRRREETLEYAQIERELNIPSSDVKAVMAGLLQWGLVQQQTASTPSFQYSRTAPFGPQVDEVAQLYSEHQALLVQAINSNAVTRARNSAAKMFADAFLLRSSPTAPRSTRKKDG